MSQTINLGNIKTVRFNGADMAEMKLNTSSVWVGQTELTISSNTNNYDIGAAVLAAGGDKATNVQLTINAGVTVGSTSTSTAAMFTGTGWSSGTTINITNNGSIVGDSGSSSSTSSGAGGNGGTGGGSNGYGTNGSSGGAGSGSADSANNGGDAFEHSQTADSNLSVIFDVAGTRTGGASATKTIYGGAGGGGGGGRSLMPHPSAAVWAPGGGGGGGMGSTGGSGGSGGVSPFTPRAASGGSGSTSSGGSGATGYNYHGWYGGNGGAGGNSGGSGSHGTPGRVETGYGGATQSNGMPGGSGGATSYISGTAGSALAGNTSQIS